MAVGRARYLRRSATLPERVLWRRLRFKQIGGHKFRRQHPLGLFVVDFVCLEQKLVIEVDGATHGTSAELARDAERTAWLVERGCRVIRVDNIEIYESIDMVGLAILEALGEYRPASQE